MTIDQSILFFLIVWIVILLCDYFFVLKGKLNYILNGPRKKNKKVKKIEINEIVYLSTKFKIEKENLYKTSIILWIAFLNSLIISLVSTIIIMINLALGWQLLIGFALLFGLIYSVYELFGRALIRKGY